MKTIGLIGGMSWESTVTYYQLINEKIREELGGLHSAKILMYSVDFAEIEKCQTEGDWEKAGAITGEAAVALEKAGADFLLICANTMHKVIPYVRKYTNIPVVRIGEVTADRVLASGFSKVLLLGTKYTLLENFITDVLKEKGLEVILPSSDEIDKVNAVIYDELCVGKVLKDSQDYFLDIISRSEAEAVIYGCTEIGLLLEGRDVPLPYFDTTVIHAEEAAIRSLK